MKNRSPAAVLLLPFVTFGIYSWYWAVKTKTEMNSLGNKVPTAWIWLIPIVGGVWWTWKYSEAVEKVTQGKITAVVAFLLAIFLGSIGYAIIQDGFNKVTPVAGNINNTAVDSQPAFTTPLPVVAQDPVLPQPPVITQPPVTFDAPASPQPPVATEVPVTPEPPVVTQPPTTV